MEIGTEKVRNAQIFLKKNAFVFSLTPGLIPPQPVLATWIGNWFFVLNICYEKK